MTNAEEYPRLFGKYTLVAPLAQGGMGELHLAISGREDLRKLLVIKLILGHLADSEFVHRFLDEAKVAMRLTHGNLVPVYEAGSIDGRYYLAMEFIDGTDLRAFWRRLRAEARICPVNVALHIVKELCRGLDFAHNFGELKLVHRDVSPPNILISFSGEVRLTDFGLAASTLKLQKTAPGILFGKLSYMSPEQARNLDIDHRTDIYALGIILWELLTGKRLFPKRSSQLEQLRQVAHPTIRLPSLENNDIPSAVDAIAMKALAAQPADRYASAELMRQDIAAALAKIDPTTDSGAVQQLLTSVYGAEIADVQKQRQQFLQDMAPRIRALHANPSQSQSLPPTKPSKTTLEPLPVGSLRETPTEEGFLSPQPTGLAPLASSRVQVGTILGERYRIDALICEGGMGIVYRATHVGIERQVAVKVLHPHYSSMPALVSRFQREAKAASRIGHPNIIEIFDSGTTRDGCFYFAMEYLTGQDLADLLQHEGPLPVSRALHIASQVCEALASAHAQDIVHRDLKPENIFLVSREGDVDFVKVLDFGIALTSLEGSSYRERLTNPGVAIGTPDHMAPEQAKGTECDHRVDVYGLGVLLYEMLVGNPPHTGETLLEVLDKRAHQPADLVSKHRTDISKELEEIIRRSLALDPADRWQSMAQLGYELNKIARGRAGAVASILGLENAPLSSDALSMPAELQRMRSSNPSTDPTYVIDALEDEDESLWAGIRRRPWLLPTAIAVSLLTVIAILLFMPSSQPEKITVLAPTPNVREKLPTPTPVPPTQITETKASDTPPPTETPSTESDADQLAAEQRQRALSMLRQGNTHMQAGRFAEAKTAFEEARTLPDAKGRALLGLAEVEFQQDNYTAARDYARQAASGGAGSQAYLVLGNAYFKMHDYTSAIDNYKKVLARNHAHAEAKRNLAVAEEQLAKTQ